MKTEGSSNLVEPEEGEITNDDPEELYTPLERPYIPTAAFNQPLPPCDSEDDNPIKESSSDSDSSTSPSKASKIRKKLVPAKKNKFQTAKKKNYNIWCSDLQTEILTNNLVDCNVDQSNERVRDVESYNYKLSMCTNGNVKLRNSYVNSDSIQKRFLGKRKHNGAGTDDKSKNKPFKANVKTKGSEANARNILSLNTNLESSEEDIARDIANSLCEEKEDLILRALNILGKETVITTFEETRDIEASGGMLIMNGARRRTPGGVFFYLLKTLDSIPRDIINLVFSEDKKNMVEEKKRTAKKLKKIKAAEFRKALSKDDFPTLLSRTELAIKQFKARKQAEESTEVKNPPPSPATDGRHLNSDGEDQRKGDESLKKYVDEGRSLTTKDCDMSGEDSMDVI